MPSFANMSGLLTTAMQFASKKIAVKSYKGPHYGPKRFHAECNQFDQSTLEKRLILPCQKESHEEAARFQQFDRGQFLARQERWSELGELIQIVDASRAMTPGGQSYATLIATGARADIVLACEDALIDGTTPDLSGIEALELVLAEHPDSYGVALVAAHAHIDIGWAWRGTGWREEIAPKNQQMFEAHFARAEAILDAFNALELNSPALASARCALLAATYSPETRVADDYEDLIDLDPANPHPMRAMGNHLLPRWFGSYNALELEARRTAARNGDTWGTGGYAWVYFDALVVDPMAAHHLDVDFFIDGLRDILNRNSSQHMANLIAAFCAISMDANRCGVPITPQASEIRTKLHACLGWILTDHLREIHPLVWAQALTGPALAPRIPSRNALLRMGHDQARAIIARHFAQDLIKGTTISFSKHGLRFYPAV